MQSSIFRYLLLLVVVNSLLFTSCSLEKRRYSTGFHVDWNVTTPVAKVGNNSVNELNNDPPSHSKSSNLTLQSLINSKSNPPSNTNNQTTAPISPQTSPIASTNFTSVLATSSNLNPFPKSIRKTSSSSYSSVNYLNIDNDQIIKHKTTLKSLVNLVKNDSQSNYKSFDTADCCAILSLLSLICAFLTFLFLICPIVSLPLAIIGLKSKKRGLRAISKFILCLYSIILAGYLESAISSLITGVPLIPMPMF